MKAILVNEDRSLRWDNVPDPIIKDDEVLVKIEAAALNRADLMQREGDYPPPAGCPEWMGLEIAGTIVEIGDEAKEKSNWKTGDKVAPFLAAADTLNMFPRSMICACPCRKIALWLKRLQFPRRSLQRTSIYL